METVAVQLNVEDCISCRACYDDSTSGYVDWDDELDIPVLVNGTLPADCVTEVIEGCPSDCYSI